MQSERESSPVFCFYINFNDVYFDLRIGSRYLCTCMCIFRPYVPGSPGNAQCRHMKRRSDVECRTNYANRYLHLSGLIVVEGYEMVQQI